jgi:hypothetical protein
MLGYEYEYEYVVLAIVIVKLIETSYSLLSSAGDS